MSNPPRTAVSLEARDLVFSSTSTLEVSLFLIGGKTAGELGEENLRNPSAALLLQSSGFSSDFKSFLGGVSPLLTHGGINAAEDFAELVLDKTEEFPPCC